jgi:flavin-dependent dehydrogenase
MRADRDTDIVVVGGGPVGLGAAIEARLAGFDVVLVEPRAHADGIEKACGEGLMPPGVAALSRLGVDVEGVPFRGIRYVAARVGRPDAVAEAPFRAGPGLGARRVVLSAALAARAQEVGVVRVVGSVGPGDRLDGAAGVPAGSEVAGVRASWVLAADGLHSPIRHRLGLHVDAEAARGVLGTARWHRGRPGTGDGRRYGLRRHYAVEPWTDLVEVHWGCDAEAYLTPVGPRLVGLAVLGPRGLGADDWWQRFPRLAERLAGATPVTPLRGAGPMRQKASRRVAGSVLLVGDAAGYVDALTGEGISLGLACAREAVACLVAGRPQDYEAAWWRVTRRYRLLTGALLAAARRPVLRRTIVPVAGAVPGLFGAIVNGLGTDAGTARGHEIRATAP